MTDLMQTHCIGIDVLLAECLTLGVKSGVQLDKLLGALDAIQLFGPSCSIYRRFPQTLFKGQFVPSRFLLKLAHKDYRLAAELAAIHRVPTRLISMCEQVGTRVRVIVSSSSSPTTHVT